MRIQITKAAIALSSSNDAGSGGTIHPVDLHVGWAIRKRRKELGLSQTQLAEALGISFQQVQKYERGSNRISASRLYEVAACLKAPVISFFPGPSERLRGSGNEVPAGQPSTTLEDLELTRDIATISQPNLRRNLVALIRALSRDGC